MKTFFTVLAGLALAGSASAQTITHSHPHSHLLASHIIVPQARAFAGHTAGTVTIAEVNVTVDIVEQVATTTMDISLTNATGRRLEAQMVVPVPSQAALRGFTFQGGASEPTAQLLAREEARKLYDEIVAKTRDPALLEFIGHSLIRSSVFPIEPRASPPTRRPSRARSGCRTFSNETASPRRCWRIPIRRLAAATSCCWPARR